MAKKVKTEVTEPTNGSKQAIESQFPYQASVTIEGVSDLLFHRWNCEEIEFKSKARKGSDIKKTDNIESYVYRDDDGLLCIPAEYMRMSIINAAKFKQDPRSSRKSAMDLYKAAIVCLSPLASLGCADWDYEDKRRVVVQRAGINRTRPAMKAGWIATFDLLCNIPEYICPSDLNETIQTAGKLIGIGDFRPSFGRFNITNFEVIN